MAGCSIVGRFWVGLVEGRKINRVEGVGSENSINESSIAGQGINLAFEVCCELDGIDDDVSASFKLDNGHLGSNIEAIDEEGTADIPETLAHRNESVHRLGKTSSE